jgi:hypothetical protein
MKSDHFLEEQFCNMNRISCLKNVFVFLVQPVVQSVFHLKKHQIDTFFGVLMCQYQKKLKNIKKI